MSGKILKGENKLKIKRLNESLIDELNSLDFVRGASKVDYELVKEYENILNRFSVGTILKHDTDAGEETFTKIDDMFWDHFSSHPPHTNRITSFDAARWFAGRGVITRGNITKEMEDNMKIDGLNESVEHPYMFQYSCNNSTFGHDFQRYAQELGARRMYDHTQKGGGLHFYTVPSEEVYNKLKEVAKKRFTVDIYQLSPFDKERFANAKVQEAVDTHKLNEWDVSEPSSSEYGNFISSIAADENDILSKYGIRRTKTRRYTSYDGEVNGHTFSYTEGHDGTTRWASSLIIDGREVDLFKSKESAKSFGTLSEKNSFGVQSLISMLNNENLDGIVYREGKFMSADEYSKSHAKLPDGTFAEAMTIAYSEDTIERMISNLKKEIEDYKQLIIDEPEDKAYWEEEIKKCQDEIADLQSYEPLDKGTEKKLHEDVEQYWAVYATDKETGKEYCAGVYESQRWAYYWAGMDRGADAEYGYGNFDYRVEQVSEYTPEMDNSKSELIDLKLRNYDNRSMTESIKRLGAGGKKLQESNRGFYVTTYWPDSRWSPEEGGTMDYGWDANRSKFFHTEQEAQAYLDDKIAGCKVISKYNGAYEYEDEYGDRHMIAIEPFHKRGQWHSPARSWAQIEFNDPVERPYFDRKGDRLARNPRLVAKERKAAAELKQSFLDAIDAATTRDELITVLSDARYSKLFPENSDIIKNKLATLTEDAPLDMKIMDLPQVPSILNWDIADKLQDYFRKNNLWVDEICYNHVKDRIEFDINWGDWKHEHMRAKWLLQELFEKLGIVAKINSYTTEDDGSDTYSAHYIIYAIKE